MRLTGVGKEDEEGLFAATEHERNAVRTRTPHMYVKGMYVHNGTHAP